MTRQQKEIRVMTPDGKVFENLNVLVDEIYLSPDYGCANPVTNKITPTGYLKIFELVPASTGLPSFSARWDEKAQTVDIDIDGVSETAKTLFKRGTNGYSGHWSQHVPDNRSTYTYAVCIQIPSQKVFEGTVSFTVVRRQSLTGRSRIIAPGSSE